MKQITQLRNLLHNLNNPDSNPNRSIVHEDFTRVYWFLHLISGSLCKLEVLSFCRFNTFFRNEYVKVKIQTAWNLWLYRAMQILILAVEYCVYKTVLMIFRCDKCIYIYIYMKKLYSKWCQKN